MLSERCERPYECAGCGRFHCKAIWYTARGSAAGPGLSIVGSSNFGRRSMDRDLEAQFWLVTTDEALQGRLAAERDAVLRHTLGPVGRAEGGEDDADWRVRLLTFAFLRFL